MLAPPPHGSLTRADLRALGWSDSAITRATRSGRLLRIRPGVFHAPSGGDPRTHMASIADEAAARACAGAAISGRSALRVHGLPVLGAQGLPELTLAPGGTSRAVRATVRRATLPGEHLTAVDGMLVTSVARTLVDVGRHRPLLAAVAAMDAALHRHLVTVDELEAVLVDCWNWPRIRRAQRAVGLVDARAESPLESISRVVIPWLGLPAPLPQARIYTVSGTFVGRADFYWDEYGVVGEADGLSKYADEDAYEVVTAQRARQERLEDTHLAVARWEWRHATVQRTALRSRIERAFDRGRARDRSGLCRGWSVAP